MMPSQGRAITGGGDRQQQLANSPTDDSSVPVGPFQSSMAMVGNSPASQTTTRSWTGPASSPSVETDEANAHPAHIQTNLHGVIGEHRRSSRSSSVSSGGSSGNNTDSADATRQGALNRLPSVSQVETASTLEGPAQQVLQQLDMDGKETPEKENGVNPQNLLDSQGQTQSRLSTPVTPSTELVSQINPLPTPCHDGADALALGFPMRGSIVSPQNSAFQGLPTAHRHGRPITGTTVGPFPAPQTASNDSELSGLLNDGGLTPGYAASQIDFDRNHDVFSLASMDNALLTQHHHQNQHQHQHQHQQHQHPSSCNVGQGGPSFTSPKSFTSNGTSGTGSSLPSFGSAQQLFGPAMTGISASITTQFQNITASFTGKQPINMPNNGFYASQQTNFASSSSQNFYSPMSTNGRQNNGYYPNAGASATPSFNSQDFSMPPPSQPWQSYNPHNPNTDVQKITCEGCHKIFKWPHILDCLHVFCFPCMVKKFDRSTQAITCQKCCHVTTLAEGPTSLRLDYQMCSEMVKMKFSPFTCTLCTREHDAASCCLVCSAYLCMECYDGHKNMIHFQGHQIKPITKVALHNGDYKPMCEKHPSEAEDKYCVTCEVMICKECLPDHVHPNMHAGNSNYDLQEAFNIVAPRLQNWNEDAFIKYSDVVDTMKRFPDLNSTMDGKKRHLKRMIDEFADYIKNVVDQCRASAMEEVENAHSQMDAKVSSMVKTFSDLATGLEGMAKFNSRTLDGGNITHVMKNLCVMETTYKRLIALYSETLKCQDGINVDFKFNPNFPSTSELLHDNFLNISYKINDVEYKVIPNSQMPRSNSRSRNFMDYTNPTENPDCNYQRWSSAPESIMNISTWNNASERDRKSGTFIPNINRCRTRTSYIHVFGEYGRGDYAFTEPSGQAYLKDGSYVICDTNNHRIVYYNANHEYVRSIGQPPNLPPLAEDQDHRNGGLRNKGFTRQEGYLYFPNRVAICPLTQNIVATERPPSHDIQIFTVDGEFKRCFGGNILQHPRGVTVDEHGTIIVVECKVMKLVMFDQEGNFLVSHSLTKDLEFPNDVAAKGDRIYISDNRGHCVQVFSYEAEFIMKIGFESVTYFPIGVSINYLNQLVVTDNHNTFNITVFDLNGKVMHIFESITKHAQCHNVAVHPSSLELMLTTKDCNVYFFNYDPNAQHPPPSSNVLRSMGHSFNSRRGRGNNSNGNGNNSSMYF